MILLLDTHAFIWAATTDARLSSNAQQLLLDPKNKLFLSMASIWEMAIKTSLNKLTFDDPLLDTIEQQVQDTGITLLPIELDHTLIVASLPWHHRDPFDRLLVAQAMHESMSILSSDRQIAHYDVPVIW